MAAYLLDANTLISAHRQYYPFDFCPGFWAWLEHKHSQGRIFSVDAVYAELRRGDDELSQWAKAMNHKGFFLDAGKVDIVPAIAQLTRWVHASNFTPEAIDKFYKSGGQLSADPVLIAYAKTHGLVVVTNEKSEPEAKKTIKIPDVCKAIQLKYIDLFALLRKEKIRLILKGGLPSCN